MPTSSPSRVSKASSASVPLGTATPATAMSAGLVIVLLSLLLGIQPMTTDLYLPALPTIKALLGASMTQTQLTLTALALSFGVSQLVWGPMSDRFGRRPILMLGLSLYVLASLGCSLAPSIELLIVWRMVQGAAMGAAVMGARAIVRDLYEPLEGARVMSKGLTGLAVFACLSAPLGSLMTELFSWRAALLMLSLFGVVSLLAISSRFKETLAQKNPRALEPLNLLRTWRLILRHPTFQAFSLLSVASYCGLFTVLAGSSFVFIDVLAFSKTQYGLLMFFNSVVYLLGTVLCRRLLPRFGVQKSVALAGGLSLLGGSLMGLLAMLDVHHSLAIILPMLIFMLGHGIHQPCGQSGAVGPFPQAAGTASALNGFLMMVGAFLIGGWLGRHLNGTLLPFAYTFWFCSVLIALSAWTLVQKQGQGRGH